MAGLDAVSRPRSIFFVAALGWLVVNGLLQADCLVEDFAGLDRWEPLVFAGIARESHYETRRTEDGRTFLHMESEAAGSALVLKEPLDASACPVVEWRWRVERPIVDADPMQRSGDDYAARIYLFFEYEGDNLPFADRVRYRAYRMLRGDYPPHSALTFVWSQRSPPGSSFANPYTERVGMRVLRGPETPLDSWQTERIDVLEEYRSTFGEDPPSTPMRLAIMTDSDDTGQKTRAAIDWIRVSPGPVN
ncbi:MAG: DUF3047 domain-containing protein [Puniceicoccaceae bacterium]|nr:MAG: DUF3047 domain-containing protein [Puniceicoccaceae bacterium]